MKNRKDSNISTNASANGIANDMPDIEELHRRACLEGSETYIDPDSGFTVFTELAHLNRGTCCGFRCRHCPFSYANVPSENLNKDKQKQEHKWQHEEQKTKQKQTTSSSLSPPKWEDAYLKAIEGKRDTYIDPSSGMKIYTELAHKKRGKCCNSGCRHCPYGENDDVGSRSDDSRVPRVRPRVRRGVRRGVVYTKTGDTGQSSLFTGERVSKDSILFEALGTVDELNSQIGVCHSMCTAVDEIQQQQEEDHHQQEDEQEHDHHFKNVVFELERIMCWLLDIGSHIATPRVVKEEEKEDEDNNITIAKKIPTERQIKRTEVDSTMLQTVESWMDSKLDVLPDLTSFILPTGGPIVSRLHVCRTVCRRAERRLLPLVRLKTASPDALKFLNRLSDYFFVLARYVSMIRKRKEMMYSTSKRRNEAKAASQGVDRSGSGLRQRRTLQTCNPHTNPKSQSASRGDLNAAAQIQKDSNGCHLLSTFIPRGTVLFALFALFAAMSIVFAAKI
mmetsp:Transcript_14605/g.29555  ORF Transcript_14605/g.29555 Transcript_14605/m.29555 type:complete len:505 (-) Transcript_14605:34-1548(-)